VEPEETTLLRLAAMVQTLFSQQLHQLAEEAVVVMTQPVPPAVQAEERVVNTQLPRLERQVKDMPEELVTLLTLAVQVAVEALAPLEITLPLSIKAELVELESLPQSQVLPFITEAVEAAALTTLPELLEELAAEELAELTELMEVRELQILAEAAEVAVPQTATAALEVLVL
jgi:hypothetical protein